MTTESTTEALPQKPPPADRTNKTNGTNGAATPEMVQRAGLAEIVRSPWNRQINTKAPDFLSLVDNVREHGIIQPLLCRPLPSALDPGRKPGAPRLELVAGERRWLAAGIAELADVPVIVRKLSDREALEQQAIENEQRQDTTPIEKAEKYQQLLEQYEKAGLGKEAAIGELCKKLSIGRKSEIGKSTVYEALRLLKLPAPVKNAVNSGTLPASHAGLIAKLPVELQARMTSLLAPGKMPTDAEDNKLQKAAGFSWIRAERDESGLISFRDAKELVDQRLERLEADAAYHAKAEEFRKKGGTALTWEEAAKAGQSLIGADDHWYEFGATPAALVKKLKEPPPEIMVQVHHNRGTPKMAYHRGKLLDALKKAGVKPRHGGGGGGSMADYHRRERERQARERIKKEILKQSIDPIRAAAAKRNAKIPWPLFIVAMAGWTANQICTRRGWKANYNNAGKVLAEHLAKMPENQMPGLVADILIEKVTTAHTGSYQPEFVELGKFYGVDVKALEKAARQKLEPAEPKKSHAKIAKPQKGETPDARKSKFKSGVRLTAAGRKKLAEAMKARWAARRKAAKK